MIMNTILNGSKKERGFTLVEILLALFIGLLLLATVYFSVISGQRASKGIESKVVAQQDVRAVLEVMAAEIGMASYNPSFAPNIWTNPPYRGIQPVPNPAPPSFFTMDTAISVQMDLDENGVLGGANETITYVYDAANQRVTRDTGGGAQPFLGDTPGNPRSVRVVNSAVGIPLFRYFDVGGNEIALADLPNNILLIRRIEITLAVDTEDIDPNTRTRRRMTYTTSVIPRNHGIY
jgi:prepilin-type N-terminal cleavage/methylation domain-containing protein